MNQRGDDDKTVDEWNQMVRVVAALLRSKADIVVVQINENGDVRFNLPLQPARVSRTDLLKMPMGKSNSLANFVGEFLVRKHQARFESLVLRDDYNQQVKKRQHQHFGLWYEPTSIRFQFHISLIHRIFNDEMDALLTLESAENH